MIQIAPEQVSPRLTALFPPDDPAGLRAFAVLNGDAVGKIFTDDPAAPTWGVAQEAAYGTVYPTQAISAEALAQVITALRQHGEVLLGLWHANPRNALIPPLPDYDGLTLDFTQRQGDLSTLVTHVPEGCTIRRIDAALFERAMGYEFYSAAIGSPEKALEKGLGYVLLDGDQIVSEAFAAPAANGLIEIGTETVAPHQGRGYATFTCATLIRACEDLWYQTYWNCAKQNHISAHLARKLGYQREREYRLLAWSKRG